MSYDWGAVKSELLALHARHPALRDFCTLPDPLPDQTFTPWMSRAAPLVMENPGASTPDLTPLRDALMAAGPHAKWRETYRGSNIGDDFVDRFGVFQLIGPSAAPFRATHMRSFISWTPPGMHYTWHHHPAEELYVVLAGEAEFAVHGKGAKILRPGDSIFHETMQPHSVVNHDQPVLSYVLWRGDLNTIPVVTPPEMLQ